MASVFVDLGKEMAWVTFVDKDWKIKWFPVMCPITGIHLEWDGTIMDHCRAQFTNENNENNWIEFGIAPTSKMILGKVVIDNL